MRISKEEKNREQLSLKTEYRSNLNNLGITLIVLVITIIVLLILAGISLSMILGQEGIFRRAENATDKYNKAKGEEERILNNTVTLIDATTNNKPNIEILKYSERTESTMKISAMATDGDREALTYILYVGTTKDNLEEQMEVKENIEQGTEVTWTVSVSNSTTKYYYKVVVKDRFAEIDSGIRETNNAPVLGLINLTKDLDITTGNWVKITTSATDQENDKLSYTLKLWKKENAEIGENELLKNEPTKTEKKENIAAGETVELTISERFRRVSRLYLLYRPSR